ncbi:MAG: hypothetical protein ACREI7_03165 [Myxococcota bacterium]
MAKEAAAFIAKLAEDPKVRSAYKRDPDAAMQKHGLSAKDRKVLKSGDPKKIREHLGDDGPPGCMVILLA